MMYINPIMLEPTTVSIAVYLLSRSTTTLTRNKRLINRNPFYMKKKICKWVLRNKKELVEIVIDETNELAMESLNLIHLNPSVFMIIYLVLLVVVIIF
jgi:hypothetical protein